jgi:hypothetical protein
MRNFIQFNVCSTTCRTSSPLNCSLGMIILGLLTLSVVGSYFQLSLFRPFVNLLP